jgi:poly(A) polymerase
VRIPRAEHTLSRSKISQAALSVLYQLHKAGYQAFLVGGGVRDVLLGRSPKDFDVVTNALPEQVKSVFLRQCRLIGRRFVLAHVHLNRSIIEVSTFRAHHAKGGDGVVENGRIVRDNVYSNHIDDDVWRRDFTVNALYYDIHDFSLIDYVNGLADLRTGTIRLIGEPLLRYQEDPVRMLRAVRFAAKLGFTIEPATAAPIPESGGLLAHIPPARLYEEVLKLFLSGHGVESFRQLRKYNLFKPLFPYTEVCFTDDPTAMALIEQVLHNTDTRIAEDKPVMPAFLLATMLWPSLLRMLPDRQLKEGNQQELLIETAQHLLNQQLRHVFIPKRVTTLMLDIWLFQLRLTGRSRGKRSLRLIEHPGFRAGYDFLLLRANFEESLKKFADWWEQLQQGDENVRQSLLPHHPSPSKSAQRKKRKKKK